MLPILSDNDKPNSGFVDAKEDAQLFLLQAISMKATNLLDLFAIQFNHAMALTSRHKFWVLSGMMGISASHQFRMESKYMPLAARHSSFLCRIGTIINTCPFPQMGRIAAYGIVALVTDKHRKWVNVRINKHGNATGPKHSILCPKLPVTINVDICHPRPALIRSASINLRPKTLDVFLGKWRQRLTIGISHLISFSDRWLEPHSVVAHRCGSFYYIPSFNQGEANG